MFIKVMFVHNMFLRLSTLIEMMTLRGEVMALSRGEGKRGGCREAEKQRSKVNVSDGG